MYSDFVTISYSEMEEEENMIMELQIGNSLVGVNDELIQIDVPAQIINNRSMMPIRFVAEKLGAEVSWNGQTKTVLIENDSTSIELPVNSTSCLLNGEEIILDVPAQIVNGRTLMPIRFIAENLGAKVSWNGIARAVLIER